MEYLFEFTYGQRYAVKIRYRLQCWLQYVCSYKNEWRGWTFKRPREQKCRLSSLSILKLLFFKSMSSDLYRVCSEITALTLIGMAFIHLVLNDRLLNIFWIKIFGKKWSPLKIPEKKLDEIAFDKTNGRSNATSAHSFIGVSNDQLVHNIGEKLPDGLNQLALSNGQFELMNLPPILTQQRTITSIKPW